MCVPSFAIDGLPDGPAAEVEVVIFKGLGYEKFSCIWFDEFNFYQWVW